MPLVLLACLSPDLRAGSPDPLEIPHKRIVTRTALSGDVTGGPEKESVVLVEYLTGGEDDKDAIGLVLGVYEEKVGGKRKLLWSRDYRVTAGGYVAGGSLALLDLSGDGRSEIIVQFQHRQQPGATRVLGEILRETGGLFEPAWSGLMRLDTAAPGTRVPPADRERFWREIDVEKTIRTRGGMIAFKKRVAVAAGAPIDPPEVIEESFPLGIDSPGPSGSRR
jgi:hypothetical protein